MRGELSAEHDLSTEQLFARVLDDLRHPDDERLDALIALHDRPTREVVERSLVLCANEDPFDRIVGLRILRELGHRTVDRRVTWQRAEPTVTETAPLPPTDGAVPAKSGDYVTQNGGRGRFA